MSKSILCITLALVLCSCRRMGAKPVEQAIVAARTTSEGVTDSNKTSPPGKLSVCNQVDPSCGMSVSDGYEYSVMYDGKLWWFCSEGCKKKFLRKKNKDAKQLKQQL